MHYIAGYLIIIKYKHINQRVYLIVQTEKEVYRRNTEKIIQPINYAIVR